MSSARTLAALLAIGALAATPAFAQGGGANWNTGFQPTYNNQAYGNQGPTGQHQAPAYKSGNIQRGNGNPGNEAEANNAQNRPLGLVDIARVQRKLRSMGLYHGAIDGKWGPETQRAVAEVQRQNDLEPTGKLDVASAEQLGLLTENNKRAANSRFQGRNGAATRPGATASAAGMGEMYGSGGGGGGGGGYVSGNFASGYPGGSGSGTTANVSPPGFFGYPSNMSNGYNASQTTR